MDVDVSDRKFEITVIATSSKGVEVRPHEKIEHVKRVALRDFGIPEHDASQYRLALSPGNPASELDDNKTVEECGLQQGSKVYLVKPHNDA